MLYRVLDINNALPSSFHCFEEGEIVSSFAGALSSGGQTQHKLVEGTSNPIGYTQFLYSHEIEPLGFLIHPNM